MGRRTSGQQIGIPTLGNVQASASTLTTTQANQDLTLDPNGTGGVVLNGNVTINAQYDLRLSDSDSSNYIAMQAASSMGSNYTITWPSAVSAANGYILSSDTSGVLSWTSPSSLGIAVSDPGSTATVHYPIFGTASGSLPTTLTPLARSNLSFVPSTGDLRAPIITGGTASGGTLTLRSTTDATKGQVYIDETTSSTSTSTGALRVGGGIGVAGSINFGGTLTRASLSGTDAADLLYVGMADNDFFRIRVGGTASNSGYAEIATADDGAEPIYVRQYSGVFTTLTRTATILDSSGNTTFPGEMSANIVTATSDVTIKENIATITDALQKVLALRGVGYNKIGEEEKEIGVIAQEIEKIVPEVVRTNTETGLKTVAYGNLVGLLIEAIKDQQTQIDELKGRLA